MVQGPFSVQDGGMLYGIIASDCIRSGVGAHPPKRRINGVERTMEAGGLGCYSNELWHFRNVDITTIANLLRIRERATSLPHP